MKNKVTGKDKKAETASESKASGTGSKTETCQQSAGSAETGCRKKYSQCF